MEIFVVGVPCVALDLIFHNSLCKVHLVVLPLLARVLLLIGKARRPIELLI